MSWKTDGKRHLQENGFESRLKPRKTFFRAQFRNCLNCDLTAMVTYSIHFKIYNARLNWRLLRSRLSQLVQFVRCGLAIQKHNKQNWMQGCHNGKRTDLLNWPLFRLTKLGQGNASVIPVQMKRKENSPTCVRVHHKTLNWLFGVVVLQKTVKKCIKICNARAAH